MPNTSRVLPAAVAMAQKTKQAHEDFVASGRTDSALHDDGLKYQRLANVLWGVTAAAAVTTTLVAIFTRWRRSERRKAALEATSEIAAYSVVVLPAPVGPTTSTRPSGAVTSERSCPSSRGEKPN